jgi:signal transduction histidine kinase
MVILTVVTAWVRWWASDRGHISHGVGVALMTVLSVTFLGVLVFWTTRKLRAAEVVRRQADRDELYRLLARSYPKGGTFLFDSDLRYILVEGSNLDEAGLSPEGMEGFLVGEVLTPEELEVIEPIYRAALEGETTSFEMPYRDQFYRVTVAPTRDEEGRVVGGIAMSQQITDERALQDQVNQLQKMDAIGLLAGGVAHDFNNLLLAIRGYSELAKSMPEDERTDEWLNEVLKASDQAGALTKQLLTFGRKQVRQAKDLNLNEVILDTQAMLDRLLAEHIEIVAALDPDLGTIKADPGQLNQILVNLAVNARDAMPTGGRLTIETKNVVLDEAYARDHLGAEPGRYAMLAVSDTGVGMDKETAARIFEPFYTTKPEGQGTGLGLSTVYGIVTQSDGYISVYSEPGWGTVFRIYLPLIDAGAEVVEEPISRRRRSAGGRILVVDDDPGVRGVIATMLHQHGYDAEVVADATEALELCESTEFDLLLTDMVTPGFDGRQIAEAAIARQPGMSVLYMSGYMPRTVEHSLPANAAFLPKPFSATELGAAVDRALERSAA